MGRKSVLHVSLRPTGKPDCLTRPMENWMNLACFRCLALAALIPAAAMLLSGGAAGKRYVLPNAKVMIHQGSGGFRGTPADIQIAAREILEMTRQMAEIISRHSGKDVEQVMRDIDRDRFLSPGEAVEYGLADSVLDGR